jgi:hypothetical protein
VEYGERGNTRNFVHENCAFYSKGVVKREDQWFGLHTAVRESHFTVCSPQIESIIKINKLTLRRNARFVIKKEDLSRATFQSVGSCFTISVQSITNAIW